MHRFGALFRRGWKRGGWRCVIAGTGPALIALAALVLVAGIDTVPGLTRAGMGHLMRLEGYAFATGFFLLCLLSFTAFTAVFAARGFTIALLVIIATFIGSVLWSTDPGLLVLAQFAGVVIVTFLGSLLDADDVDARLRWLLRLGFMLAAYVVTVLVCDPPTHVDSWREQDSVVATAAMYFGLLAMGEFSGLYYAWQLAPAPQDSNPAGSNVELSPAAAARAKWAALLRSHGDDQCGS